MDRVRAGLIVRALRRHQRLRQVDVARRAGVCQQTISNIERGRFGAISIDVYLRVVEALGADVSLAPQWRGSHGARLLDASHAHLQQLVARQLVQSGWAARSEYTFNHFGERGSADILGIQVMQRAILIVETKSGLVSVEETIRKLDMKGRVIPAVLAAELGWRPVAVGLLLVLPEGTTHREAVARHRDSLGRTLPARGVEIRKWIQEPSGPLRGIWFFRDTTPMRTKETLPRPIGSDAPIPARFGPNATEWQLRNAIRARLRAIHPEASRRRASRATAAPLSTTSRRRP